MNKYVATISFCTLCVVMMIGLIYVTMQPRAEITIISGEAIIKVNEFTYKIQSGETFLGIFNGDSKLNARIRTSDGIIRFQHPQERP